MDFSNAPTQQGGFGELIPAGTLAWAWLVLRPFNLDQGLIETPSKSSDNQYLDVELTITDGPFSKRKLWDMIGVAGTEKYVQAGHAAIRHILEVGRGAGPTNPAGYQINDYTAIDQIKVAVKVTIEKGKDGHEDKNRVRYLSPNPASDTCADFKRLLAGDTAPKTNTPAAAAAPAANAWGGPAPAAPAAQPAAAPAAQPAPAAPATGTAKPSWL